MAEEFDAIIVGGGPGGATAGLILARAGWKVAVIEKAEFPRRKVCGEYVSATNRALFRRLDLEKSFLELAGPPVRRVGLFAGETILTAPMPQTGTTADGFGQALGREQLDTLLLDRAAGAGARVWQPWSGTHLSRRGDTFLCKATSKETRKTIELGTRIVIAAHGSWEAGALPTQSTRRAIRSSDLFAFKAHFRECSLAVDLMPLLVFRGGYGGMVHTSDGRVSLSCCVRRDELERCRRAARNVAAAQTVLAHVTTSCRGAREALAGARTDGGWLSTGPVQPGIRSRFKDGIFFLGNAAGEAHPIIAEGISMAMQSAWLLCERLIARQGNRSSSQALGQVGRDYSTAWRSSFVTRIRAAAWFAQMAMRPAAVELFLPVLRVLPTALTLGAKWSGKATNLAAAAGQVLANPNDECRDPKE
jgi:menaquinone-9 beta-reductase